MFLQNLVCCYIVHKILKESDRYYEDDEDTSLKESVIDKFIPKSEDIPEIPDNRIKMVLGSKKRVIYLAP